ncbi:MAG: hypothetical protein AABP62_24370 [Planctomycetota bacterium]
MPAKTQNRRTSRRTRQHKRRGSTLLIVMVLMGMLSLLGVLFYTFAAQERSNSEYYSEASKNLDDPGLSADVLMDWALQQIIVSTDPRLKNSALWGSRHSMLSNMLGRGDHRPGDTHPYNGEGVNIIFDASGAPIIDQDRNGIVDPTEEYDGDKTASANELLRFNDSPSANNQNERDFFGEDRNRNGIMDAGEDTNGNGKLDGVFPQPDVGYSYPDINNVYLSYVSKVRDSTNKIHQVVIPSYFRPQYLRDGSGAPITDWYLNTTTTNKVMRAHAEHVFVKPSSTSGTPFKRYLQTDAEAAAVTGIASARKFPFEPMLDAYNTSSGGSGPAYSGGTMGVWTRTDDDPTPQEDTNMNGVLDSGEDTNGNGMLDGDHFYAFDIDLDGDGIKEAVWMDLDFPPQENAAGEMFVPMYAVTIVDLDSLMNINLHGHTTKTQSESLSPSAVVTPLSISSATGTPFSGSGFLSGSNLGISPAEVNPAWALTARPGVENSSAAALDDHNDFFGGRPQDLSSLGTPGPIPTWREAANMELLWLKVGRAKISGGTIDDTFPGVYGEEHILAQNYSGGVPHFTYLPRPGVSVQDDNGDVNEGMQLTPPPAWSCFSHPLDFAGLGTYLLPLSGNPADAKKADFQTAGRSRWLRYNIYADNGRVRWGLASVGGLMNNSLANALGDDAMEVAHYAEDKRDLDDPLKAEEMLALQLNNTWISKLTLSSRALNLAPFNFAKDSSTNSRGEQIRRRFTVQSNDRKNYGLPYSPARSWEYSYDTAPYSPTTQGPYVRDDSSFLRFPPEFGSSGSTIRRYSTEALLEDPLRPPVRYWLEIERNSTKTNRWQRKLSVNQLLTVSGNQLTYRALTQHPDDPGVPAIVASAYPPSTVAGFEYWARRDRQQLARDIYVLLYLMGRGPNGTAGTDTPVDDNSANAVYTVAQMQEMAHFAVNVVDSMDSDNVITRFEYDENLSDGWNLDDDPYTSSGESDRAEVFGVERLDLTISESVVVHTADLTSDASSTQFDDTTARNFAYFELRNIGPDAITFDAKETWQLVLKQEPTPGTPLWERRVSFKTGAGSIGTDSAASPNPSIYTIGSADFDRGGAMLGRSNFEVDDSGGSTPTKKIPGSVGVCDLDMIDPVTPSTDFLLEEVAPGTGTITDRTATKGELLGAFGGATPIGNYTDPIKVQLRRRAHPTRTKVAAADDNDNPWVTVDATQFDISQFDITAGPTAAATIQPQLTNLKGLERRQPLERTSVGEVLLSTDQGGYVFNTFGADNAIPLEGGTTTFTLWQPHFDRDFPSLMDLFYVPVCGPERLTAFSYGMCRQSPSTQFDATATGNGAVANSGITYEVAKNAAGKVLLPAHPTDTTGASDNRWHRLFEFLEVPTRTNKNLGIGTDLSITRVPGRVNLNMLRHPEVYAGLIDDSRMVSLNLTPGLSGITDDPEIALMPDQTSESGRDWWQEFIKSRDPIDPHWASAASPVTIPLPGLPGARPFRSNAFLGTATVSGSPRASVDDTIFRRLALDMGTSGPPSDLYRMKEGDAASTTSVRRLLEVGNDSEHQATDNTAIDPYIRHRLLSKIHGNSTTRSHSYAVFIAVKYFIAGEQSGAIRIGGPLNGKPEPEHRGFFVVDRSKLEKGGNAGVGGYDFRAFVDYRRIIQTQ